MFFFTFFRARKLETSLQPYPPMRNRGLQHPPVRRGPRVRVPRPRVTAARYLRRTWRLRQQRRPPWPKITKPQQLIKHLLLIMVGYLLLQNKYLYVITFNSSFNSSFCNLEILNLKSQDSLILVCFNIRFIVS